MSTQLFREDIGAGMLTPAIPGYPTREYAAAFGASLTLKRGQAVARKTTDGKMYPLNTGASDGTQVFGGFSRYSLATDANSVAYFLGGTSPTAQGDTISTGQSVAPIYTSGVFDPTELVTNASPVAELDTFTPGGTITTGDVNTVTITYPNLTTHAVSFTVGATTTAAAVSAGLITAWNADPAALAYGTPGGTSTFTVTSAVPGNTMNLASAVTGVGTLTKAVTTSTTGRAIADILPGCPGARVIQPTGYWHLP